MEFNRDRSCRPGYLPDVNARSRQIILVPTTYHSIPEPPYQSFLRGPYQPLEQFPQGMHPPLPCLGVGAQNVPLAMLQTQSYHSQERNSQNVLEVSEPPLPRLQSQTLPFQVPMLSNVEEVLLNDGYNGMADQDTRQSEDLGIDMSQLPEMCKGNSYDTGLTARPAAPPPDMACRSCGGSQRWISAIEQIVAAQKQTNKALSLFSDDVISDMEENKQWRCALSHLLKMYVQDEVNDS